MIIEPGQRFQTSNEQTLEVVESFTEEQPDGTERLVWRTLISGEIYDPGAVETRPSDGEPFVVDDVAFRDAIDTGAWALIVDEP